MPGTFQRLEDQDTGDVAIELFRLGALQEGNSEEECRELERALFGRTFEDQLSRGYQPSLALRDDKGD